MPSPDSRTPSDGRESRSAATASGSPAGPQDMPSQSAPRDAMKAAAERVGLSQAEAARRLHEAGFNEIPEESISTLRRFLGNFWGPIPWMLEVAALVATLLQAWGTFLIILGNLGLNAIVAFWEEQRASQAISALRARLTPYARVCRDSVWTSIAARELVPGDVIHVRLGDIIPADARMLSGVALALDRASLTGESLPVETAVGDLLYAGTIVRRGEADAVVEATGRQVHFATTIQLVQKTVPVGHLQRIIVALSRYLILIALVLDLLILGVAAFRQGDLAATLEYALLLLVAAVPAAMPTVLSVTMAVGALRLARDGVLISRLTSVEELAAMDRLCADKTGTLTRNALTAGEPFCIPPATVAQVFLDAALASRNDGSDPIDQAMFDALPKTAPLSDYEILTFTPFDPERKRAEATVRRLDGQPLQVVKGAPQVLMDLARVPAREKEDIQRAIDAFASRGYRSLAVARQDAGNRWQLEGIIPLYDPLRPDAKQMVDAMRALGVEVQLLTGDQHAIGAEVAKAVGLTGSVLDADQLTASDESRAHPQQSRDEMVESIATFAQVLPEHKYSIVEALQRRGHIVGMTGDGINDTPALRKADVGVAVPGSSEAARAASDLVLVRQGLMPLVEALRESRRIFQRMRTYVIYRVAETIRRLLALTLAVVLFNFYPVTPAMLALLATFNALVLIALAYDETQPSAQPEVWRMAQVMYLAGALSAISLAEFFGLFFLGHDIAALPHAELQTVMFVALTAAGYFTLLVARTRGPFWSLRPATVLLLAIGSALGMSLGVALLGWFMTPISWQWVLLTLGYSTVWFIIGDLVKQAVYRLPVPHRKRTPR